MIGLFYLQFAKSTRAALLLTGILLLTQPAHAESTKPNLDLANISFTTQQGVELSLRDFQGSLVLLNFWATWCAPCIKEMPDLSALQEEYKGKGLKVLTVSQDIDAAKPLAFLKKHEIENLPFYHDPKSIAYKASGAIGLPVSILISPDTKEIKRFTGYVNWLEKDMTSVIETHLP